MKIALCDDDEKALKSLYDLVELFFDEKSLIAEITCFLSSVELLQNFCEFDLLVLDIDMPEMNGIALAKKIRTKDMDIKIIYATSHKKYIYQVFTVHPFGYMIKPITKGMVFNNLNDFLKSRQQSSLKKIIVLPKGKAEIILLAEEILYFEYCAEAGIKITTIKGEEYVHLTLTEIFRRTEIYDFAFCHKGCIVNLGYIKRIKGFELELSNGTILPIAQKRAAVFRETHHDFLQGSVQR